MSIDTITLHSPRSKITIPGDFNVYNPNWLTHSSHITSPTGSDAAVFVSQNFFHSSSPPLKINSSSPSCAPSSKANLFASTFASNFNLDYQESQSPIYATSTITMSPIKFSTCKCGKSFFSSTPPNLTDPEV